MPYSLQDLMYAYFAPTRLGTLDDNLRQFYQSKYDQGLNASNDTGGSGTSLPPGGATNTVLTKNSPTDQDVSWKAVTGIPPCRRFDGVRSYKAEYSGLRFYLASSLYTN